MEFIDLKKQYETYKTEINCAIQKVLDSGKFILGEEVELLERELADFVQVKHCMAVSSGTDSLLIALMALGVGPGDEVITVPFTFISTVEVILLLGAKPVFVDIDAKTFNMDVSKLEGAITEKTKAIMPVSLFGQMADFVKINEIAAKYALAVIEDGAQSFGASQNGKKSCGVTTIGSTSFFPAKPLGCYGDGGALFTDDDQLAEKMLAIRTHGSRKKYYHPVLGINGRFDTLQAAIVLAKFQHYASEVRARENIGQRYSEKLRSFCTPPFVAPGNTHVFAQYTVLLPMRDHVAQMLKEKGIPTAIYYPLCLHEQPIVENYKKGDFPVAEKAAKEVLSLPMHPWLNEEEQDKIVFAVKEALAVNV